MLYDPFSIDHRHNNLLVLDKFSAVDNVLLWDGQEIGSSSQSDIVWGSITGDPYSNASLTSALNLKLSISNFPNGVRQTALLGFDATNKTDLVDETDTLIEALEKLQYQLQNIPTSGGSTSTSNNVSGVFNVYSDTVNSRYAVPNNHISPGSLVLSARQINSGGGVNGWNSNTAQVLLEYGESGVFKHTEIATHIEGIGLAGAFRFFHNGNLNGNINREVTYGRNMGGGSPYQVHRFAGNALVIAKENKDLTAYAPYFTEDRPSITVEGQYPYIQVISRYNTNTSFGNGFKFLWIDQSNTFRSLNIGQIDEGKEFNIGFWQGTDTNHHYSLRDLYVRSGISFIMPGFSANNILGTAFGVGINTRDIKFNLSIKGQNDSNGTLAYGINNSRTEKKSNANALDTVYDKQSGFYQAVDTPSNYPPNSDINTMLINAQHPAGNTWRFQISNNRFDNDSIFSRVAERNWQELLKVDVLTGLSNSVLPDGNTHNTTLKIGTKNNHEVYFLQNNEERFRLINRFQLLINPGSSNGIAYPHLAFLNDQGTGISLESSGQLAFVTGQTKRLWVNSSTSIESNLYFNTTQHYRINNTIVLREPTSVASLPSNATQTDIINKVNEIINALKTHHRLLS